MTSVRVGKRERGGEVCFNSERARSREGVESISKLQARIDSAGVGQRSGIHPSSAVLMVGIGSAGEGNPRDKSPRQRASSVGLTIGSADE